MFTTLELKTNSQTEFLDITNLIRDLVSQSEITDGLCQIFIPHTTAAVTINENADPTVKKDMLKELNKIIPFDDNYQHFEGNSAAHIKSSIIGPALAVIIQKGQLMLGTWQGIFFCEFDGPRRRKIWIKVMEG
jgi:secondary thiamine-phosphate synthase enzyme